MRLTSYLSSDDVGQFIPKSPVQLSPSCLGRPSAPLLEEERHRGPNALVADLHSPVGPHRSMTSSTLSPRDHPVNPTQVERQRAQEGLARQEAHPGRDERELPHPEDDVLA